MVKLPTEEPREGKGRANNEKTTKAVRQTEKNHEEIVCEKGDEAPDCVTGEAREGRKRAVLSPTPFLSTLCDFSPREMHAWVHLTGPQHLQRVVRTEKCKSRNRKKDRREWCAVVVVRAGAGTEEEAEAETAQSKLLLRAPPLPLAGR